MNKQTRKFLKQYAKSKSEEVGDRLVVVPKMEWPKTEVIPSTVWRNRKYIVQVFFEGDTENDFVRISVSRNDIKGFRSDGSPDWKDQISWDDLQSIKNQIGYQDRWAVECYPPQSKVVNVANMRHLWLLPEPPIFGWHRGASSLIARRGDDDQ